MKPAIKREVAIKSSYPNRGLIHLYASREAALEFSEFGLLTSSFKDSYWLRVDPRFDFGEVLEYIESY